MINRAFKILLSSALIAFAASDAFAQEVSPAKETPASQEASEFVGFKLKSLDGKVFDSSAMSGEVIVASFGATWCVPCVWELKAIEELVEEYKERPVRFFWISIEEKERTPDAALKRFAKTYRLTIPVLRDEDGSAFRQFSDSRRIPLVVFFDREGKFIAPVQRGMSSDPIQYKEKLRKRVNALLQSGAATGKAEASK